VSVTYEVFDFLNRQCRFSGMSFIIVSFATGTETREETGKEEEIGEKKETREEKEVRRDKRSKSISHTTHRFFTRYINYIAGAVHTWWVTPSHLGGLK
jgi:hypothetical protein